ncbi:MAG TPA: hypothetical protein PKV17_01525 [Aquabacterium sp.]|nr:hypothetical protein [Aquabacterium sp.]HRH27440.1 hypothetical protein [Aquabacterium sp.]
MAKPNYQFEKRQREMEKKKKKAEKAFKKTLGPDDAPSTEGDAELDPAAPAEAVTPVTPEAAP